MNAYFLKFISTGVALVLTFVAFGQESTSNSEFLTTFEKSKGTETPTYKEVIEFYEQLAKSHKNIHLQTIGATDSGYPLHYITYSQSGTVDFSSLRKDNRIIFINNGIHPGESDGIDASMLLFRDLALKKITIPKHTVLVTIPIYNIGGALNRNSTTRTNQNGPKAYGFRGNARNYDLNRDFIKSDTYNAKTFAQLFHLVQPDLFIDTHVSNGADYQYTLTHLLTQHNKLGTDLGMYLHNEFQPTIEKTLAAKNWDVTPYVNVWGTTPDKGWSQFMDSPRYSTGYTTLWNTIGLMIETHMLKPYKKRVEGTYELLKTILEITEKEGHKINQLRTKAFQNFSKATTYPIQWELDSTKHTKFQFKGYEGAYSQSELTGGKRLQYFSDKPYNKAVTYYDYYKPKKEIVTPKAYIIPQGWHKVIELLKLNQVAFHRLEKDTIIPVEVCHISGYQTRKTPYEGHYLHYDTQTKITTEKINFRKGAYWVDTNQRSLRYLLETLEPEAVDSFFNWNFFDTILQQKEGFSPYVWEDKAKELLASNPKLAARFAEKRKDPVFAKDAYAQLDWLHKNSSNYEKSHLRYPIFRVTK